MPGKLIVIDGADGAGKKTQARLLAERFKSEGIRHEQLDFPRYEDNFFGKLLRECLDGAYGDFMSVHPKIASALYAADRFESSKRIEEWLNDGAVVILDRYVSANMLHQGSKIQNEEARAGFLSWLDDLEHGVFNLPRPDLIVYLDMPHHIRKELITTDTTRKAPDLAEQHEEHQKATEACAKWIATRAQKWHVISCFEDRTPRKPEDIHEDIYTQVRRTIFGTD